MNYMIKGIQALKESVFLGIIIYIVIFVLLYLFKKRRTISWNYMFEGIFCIYCVTLLNLTGIFTLSYSLNGPFNYNLLPFIGSSIVPILLNFALFCPLGFLLPLVFRSCRGNWKKVAIISGLISFLIELLPQLLSIIYYRQVKYASIIWNFLRCLSERTNQDESK